MRESSNALKLKQARNYLFQAKGKSGITQGISTARLLFSTKNTNTIRANKVQKNVSPIIIYVYIYIYALQNSNSAFCFYI